ncbi:MAG: 16S rRNA (uracil(1498)-N(3))-methyltransferase [Spirochaetales bacterium]|nr:16S rRNA (uracil(1498)-N(3))-methyltransferase [Spirochaetales bacterium]
MRVFLLPEDAVRSRRAVLRGEDFHYLARVLRLGAGTEFQGCDGEGGRWLCRVVRTGRDFLEARLERKLPVQPAAGPPIILVQLLPKGRKMDTVVRQAAEAGVSRLLPVLGRYSLYRFDGPEDVESKLRRWRRVAREALQQSGAAGVLEIEPPRELADAVGEPGEGEIRLVFHQERRGRRSLHECLASGVQSVCVVVGPEGGLAAEELELLLSKGFVPITVGTSVLRTETAAVFAVAAIRTILEERQAWQPAP